MAGETAKPGWIANVNPFVVVCCVSFVTRWMAKRSAITSMNIGMFLIPVSALLMACGNLLDNEVVSGMSNITLMMIAGIVVQGLAECFISPRYLEYFSLQASLDSNKVGSGQNLVSRTPARPNPKMEDNKIMERR